MSEFPHCPDPNQFSAALLNWYDQNARDLPWRGAGVSPYRTWVSEVMLQQTRVEAVKPYFARFMDRFPTIEVLAAADNDDVLAHWSGLGYYSRARNLHKGAQAVVAEGGFPTDEAGLRRLPGVGPYIAGAVGSIALGLPLVAVDGNLERVLARLVGHPGGRVAITRLAERLLTGAPHRAGDFNQALMDIGATICVPRNPACDRCPLQEMCRGAAEGTPTAYPAPKPKKVVPERRAVAAVFQKSDGEVLLAQRPAEGLFGGLFELPGGFVADPSLRGDEALKTHIYEQFGVEVRPRSAPVRVFHVLTHMRLTLEVFDVDGPFPDRPLSFYTSIRWVRLGAYRGIGLSTLARKALKAARP